MGNVCQNIVFLFLVLFSVVSWWLGSIIVGTNKWLQLFLVFYRLNVTENNTKQIRSQARKNDVQNLFNQY